ncbi:MAG TPA: Hpt domain-containing protein [Limnobacter sp.]|nr:Hpt domain-containing protein [Limnobacter sp.]
MRLDGIDIEEAMMRLMGNKALLLRVIKSFLHEYSLKRSSVSEMLDGRRFDELKLFLHTFKGMAANVAAQEAFALAQQAEHGCAAQDVDTVRSVLLQLDEFMSRLERSYAACSTMI